MKLLSEEVVVLGATIAIYTRALVSKEWEQESFMGLTAGINVMLSLTPWKQVRIAIFQLLVSFLAVIDMQEVYMYAGFPAIIVGCIVGWVLSTIQPHM